MESPVALYIHIPFCHALCHYCDFSKTANFDSTHVHTYFERIKHHLELILPGLKAPVSSVFFGGGTPGLFAKEYRPIFQVLRRLIADDAEVSLEANPRNCSHENLAVWGDLGFNRLSIGIQTFDEAGLKFLTRDHTTYDSEASIRNSRKYFKNVNVDLIYGWNGQTESSWERDLSVVGELGVPHLSLYNLTYEPRTPIGRAHHRGRLAGADEVSLLAYYERARQVLGATGYLHEEVSNWSQPGFSCRHNWVYWSGGTFVGIGAGAHGFIDDGTATGFRYAFSKDLRAFLRAPAGVPLENSGLVHSAFFSQMGAEIDADRDLDSALTEYVGSSLRTAKGVSLQRMAAISLRTFRPRASLRRGLAEGMLEMDDERTYLRLKPAEWFRENAWAVEVILSFV